MTDWPDAAVQQATLRERFRSAYARTREPPEIPDVYRIDARLRLMKHLDVETGELDDAAVDARVEEHLASLEALGAL